MLANEKGNMREAYLAYAEENEERVRYVETQVAKQGGFGAEVVPEAEAQWLVVVTMPGEEGVASGHLIARGFGVYQPLYPKTYMRRGRKIQTMRPMFPNYLFVHVWGVEQHMRRILACTGVHHVLQLGDAPAIVPWRVINKIRETENKENPLAITLDDVVGQTRKRPRMNKKARRKAMRDLGAAEATDRGLDVVATYSWGFSRSRGTWDEAEAVASLHKALGIAA